LTQKEIFSPFFSSEEKYKERKEKKAAADDSVFISDY
jgi:hypothetical protein